LRKRRPARDAHGRSIELKQIPYGRWYLIDRPTYDSKVYPFLAPGEKAAAALKPDI
jgi:hypothetical protein